MAAADRHLARIGTARRLRAADVPGAQLGQRLAQPLPRGRQDQRHLGPVLAGLLGDLREVGDLELFAVKHQVVQRPPGGDLDVVGQLDLRLGGRRRLEERQTSANTVRARRRTARRAARRSSAAASSRCGDALAGGDLAPPAERGGGGRGQVAGHPRQLVVAGPPGAQRPGERGRGGLGQVAEEAEPGLSASSASSSPRTASRQRSTSARSRASDSRRGSAARGAAPRR